MRHFTFILFLSTVFLLVLEIGLRYKIDFPINKFKLYVEPKPMFEKDANTGWSLSPGEYNVYINDKSTSTQITINENCNRTSGGIDGRRIEKKIHLYGCSNTFGYSIADSLTQGFLLQKALPSVKIENFGVPAFGLTQMYLQLVENVNTSNKPNIAVFNYADFHIIRSPLNRFWSFLLFWSFSQRANSDTKLFNYPYFDLTPENEIALKTISFKRLNKKLPFIDKSAIVYILNEKIDSYYDMKNEEKLILIANKTIKLIVNFCKQNDIHPIIAYYKNSHDFNFESSIIDDLIKENVDVLIYSIDYSNLEYNNCPHDCAHPNAKAQRIFAEELYNYILSTNLISHD